MNIAVQAKRSFYMWSYDLYSHTQRTWGGRHSSVVSSASTILWPRVRIPSTPSTLFFNLCYWNCIEKMTKINKKRPGLAHLKKIVNPFFFRARILEIRSIKCSDPSLGNKKIHFHVTSSSSLSTGNRCHKQDVTSSTGYWCHCILSLIKLVKQFNFCSLELLCASDRQCYWCKDVINKFQIRITLLWHIVL